MNTKGYGGRTLRKTITVHTNDPDVATVKLTIGGAVDNFASIRPNRVRLNGRSGDRIVGRVTIVPEEKYNFNVTGMRTRREGDIDVKLDTVEKKSRKEYVLTIENKRQGKARYFNAVVLKTDSAIQPSITIPVYGNISADPDDKEKNPS